MRDLWSTPSGKVDFNTNNKNTSSCKLRSDSAQCHARNRQKLKDVFNIVHYLNKGNMIREFHGFISALQEQNQTIKLTKTC